MFTFSHESLKHTKSIVTVSLAFLLFVSLFSATGLTVVQGETKDANYVIRSTVTYVNPRGGTKTWNLTEEDRTISLFMNNSWQTVTLINSTSPFDALKSDADGNIIAVLKLPKQQLYPGENVSYTVEYRVVAKPRTIPNISEEKSDTLNVIPQSLKENFTRAEAPWLVNDSTLVRLAHEIVGNKTNVLKIITSFVRWIKDNINYTRTHEFPLYSNETLSAGEGDCDDQAILLITLFRIMGIPSYLQVGAIYMPVNALVQETVWDNHVRIVQRKIGWHGWAMVYVPPWGWLPVDLTYVPSGFADPLNAIRYGAVTGQNTVQYMNFSRVNYVVSSRQTRAFILENGFFMNFEDEMAIEAIQNGTIGSLDPTALIALAAITVMLVPSSFLLANRWRKRLEKTETPTP